MAQEITWQDTHTPEKRQEVNSLQPVAEPFLVTSQPWSLRHWVTCIRGHGWTLPAEETPKPVAQGLGPSPQDGRERMTEGRHESAETAAGEAVPLEESAPVPRISPRPPATSHATQTQNPVLSSTQTAQFPFSLCGTSRRIKLKRKSASQQEEW